MVESAGAVEAVEKCPAVGDNQAKVASDEAVPSPRSRTDFAGSGVALATALHQRPQVDFLGLAQQRVAPSSVEPSLDVGGHQRLGATGTENACTFRSSENQAASDVGGSGRVVGSR